MSEDMYLIIGSNRVAKSVIQSLESSGEEVSVWERGINNDGSIEDKTGFTEMMKRSDLILILLDDFEKTIAFLDFIKGESPDQPVLSYAERTENKGHLLGMGCDSVISQEEVASESVLFRIERLKRKEKNHRMVRKILGTDDDISIFIHDNPDPDAIASAMSFEKICDEVSKHCTTYYSGEIGFPENKIFVESTGFDMDRLEEWDVEEVLDRSGRIVFIDFAKPGINNIVPERYGPDIVIDHHRTNVEYETDGFVEISTDVGATSTIMAQFLMDLDVDIGPTLASALVYGIKVDTRDYTKNIGKKDFNVLSHLMQIADKELLEVFESPPMEPHTLDALGRALSNRVVGEGVLTAYAGEIDTRDDLPQIVDIMTGEKDIMTALVYGSKGGKVYMSARSKDITLDLGKKMKEAFSDIGQAGGHDHAAGGSIDIKEFDGINMAKDYIETNFREEVY